MTTEFRLVLEVNSSWGLNRFYSGEHWNIRKSQAAQVHTLVRTAVRKQCRNIEMFEKPVAVHIRYNSRLDIDNHGYLAKLIIDGMKGILIRDDDRHCVRELRQSFHACDKRLIFVVVSDD